MLETKVEPNSDSKVHIQDFIHHVVSPEILNRIVTTLNLFFSETQWPFGGLALL